MNRQVKVTWITLRTIAHSLLVHVIFTKSYIHFILLNMTDHIFQMLPINDLINEDGESTTPLKLVTDQKTSISNLGTLFFPCVVRNAISHAHTKAFNMRHQAQKGFQGIFIGIPQHQIWYLV